MRRPSFPLILSRHAVNTPFQLCGITSFPHVVIPFPFFHSVSWRRAHAAPLDDTFQTPTSRLWIRSSHSLAVLVRVEGNAADQTQTPSLRRLPISNNTGPAVRPHPPNALQKGEEDKGEDSPAWRHTTTTLAVPRFVRRCSCPSRYPSPSHPRQRCSTAKVGAQATPVRTPRCSLSEFSDQVHGEASGTPDAVPTAGCCRCRRTLSYPAGASRTLRYDLLHVVQAWWR